VDTKCKFQILGSCLPHQSRRAFIIIIK
jgi:hypothetical protein